MVKKQKLGRANGLEWLIFIVVLMIPVSALTFSQNYSVIGQTSGDAYYEYRCIDVQQYLDSGWSAYSTDEYGCTLIRKNVYLAPTRIDIDCDNAYKDYWCEQKLGNSFQYAGYCEKPSSGRLSLVCGIPSYEYNGGYEQVVNTCHYDPNDLLAAETFDGGSMITKFSLRYPVKGFCLAHPAIYTDAESLTSQTSTVVYEDLDAGETVTVPAHETLTLFYIMENNDNLPTICNSADSLALNLETNTTCSSTLGFTYLCSEGQFDALSGTCVVQPESNFICDQGRYDVLTGTCIYNPPLQVDCGRDDAYYSVDRNECIFSPETAYDCPAGFEFEEPTTAQECSDARGQWDLCPQCPEGQVCDQSICSPECSTGQSCVWTPDSGICDENNASITNSGYCVLEDGTRHYLCGDDLKYDSDREICVGLPESRLTCGDDQLPVFNSKTGQEECVINEVIFESCPDGQVFNLDKCVSQVAVYDDTTGQVEYLTADELKNYYSGELKDYLQQGRIQLYLIISIVLIIGLFLLYLRLKRKR